MNATDKAITIAKDCHLGHIDEIEADGYFLTIPEDWSLTISPTTTCLNPSPQHSGRAKTNSTFESTLDNGITVYEDDDTRRKLAEVALAYPMLWKESAETVDIPKD